MCNFCNDFWRRKAAQQKRGKNNKQKTRTKTKKASPVSAKRHKQVVSSYIPSSTPSDADVLADLPSTSVRTIKIPNRSLEPVEDSNIFKWKQFREKVESSMKQMKKKFTQLRSGKKDKRRSERSLNKVSIEEDSEKTEDDDDRYNNHCRDCRSHRRSAYRPHSRSPQSRHSRSPHQSPKAKAKRKTAETVDARNEEGRKSKVRTPTTKSPSRHSPKKTLVSFIRETLSTDEPKINSAVERKLPPSPTPTNATTSATERSCCNDQNDHPKQQFTTLDTDSSKSNSSRSSHEGKYYSNLASDKSPSLD